MDMQTLSNRYANITRELIRQNLTISTMESCTSGLVASLITDVEGSSKALHGAFVTYSNQAKIDCGVSATTIEDYGVYSKETAEEMALACMEKYGADIGVGITGTCGNVDTSNSDSEVGVIYCCIINHTGNHNFKFRYLLPLGSTRLDYKMAIANEVAEHLEAIIGLN